jgi:iron complex outermembrane recepter protein
MKARSTGIAMAVAMILSDCCSPTQAQSTGVTLGTVSSAAPEQGNNEPSGQAAAAVMTAEGANVPGPVSSGANADSSLETVVVTGVRYSLEKSINTKRQSNGVEEVVSAEDIGKLPDKNIADAVERLPGVNTSKAGAGEGGFSENDRVAIRGTSPSLTQTLINGHTIATGDWFIQDQSASGGGTIGRSISYSLLPAEIADTIVVHKSAQADLIEGGVAGAVDIQTRKPLGFKKQLTAEITAQAFYNDLPNKADPQLNALVNWKNSSDTFGALLQYFREDRHERRDGQEFLGYGVINGKDEQALVQANPNLNGVSYPELINATLLQHRRYRHGGVLDLQWEPSDTFSIDLNGLYSHLHAPSFDTSFLADPSSLISSGIVPTSYTVHNNVLVAANFPDVSTASSSLTPGLSDKIYRPFAFSETYFLDLTGVYRPTSNLTLTTKVGHSRGIGSTPGDMLYEGAWTAGGLNYLMNGTSRLASVTWPAPGQTTGNGPYVSNFYDQNVFTTAASHSIVRTVDQENYGQADAEFSVRQGPWESVKVGVRFSDHERTVHWPAEGSFPFGTACEGELFCPANQVPLPSWNGQAYPGNFLSGLNPPAGYPANFWQLDPNAVYAWQQMYDPAVTSEQQWGNEFSVQEKTSAAYAMADVGGTGWHGNFGVRVVRTRENVLSYSLPEPDATGTISCSPTPYMQDPVNGGCDTTGTINYYTQNVVAHTYTDVLPSASFKFDLAPDVIGRLAVARTLSRPDYAALAPTAGLDDLALAGSAGNSSLKPVRSTNFDAALEWYFQPRSLLSVGLFYMDLTSFVEFQNQDQFHYNMTYGHNATYAVSVPVNVPAYDRGLEIAYQQPLPWHFGVYLNSTLADGRTADHQNLYGASKFTGNAELYWENEVFSARAAYNYRSTYLEGLVEGVPEYDAGIGDVSLSVNYKATDWLTVTFDGLNLNNPVLKEYGFNQDMPEAFYVNGRQYFLGVRLSF